MSKITSVREEKKKVSKKDEKKEMLKFELKKNGLPEFLPDLKLTIKENDTPTDLLKKFQSSIRKEVKTRFFNTELEDRFLILDDELYRGDYQIEVSPVTAEYPPDHITYLQRLVKRCSNLVRSNEKPAIVKVTINRGDKKTVGYSLLNGEVKKAYAWTRRSLVGFNYSAALLLDLPSLLADILVCNTLLEYIRKHPKKIEYLFLKNFLDNPFHQYKTMPTETQFQKDFIERANKYEFSCENATPHLFVDSFKKPFYNIDSVYLNLENDIIKHFPFILAIQGILEQTTRAKNKVNQLLAERSNYARSPETKKGIKNSHQKRMADNRFLSHYGFVELDNDVDLEKFSVIEANFDMLVKWIPIPARKDYSFRIKKLGKLHAAGVFYPSYKTTIFDIDHPDAYIHECWHQIDHILGQQYKEDYYSETVSFQRIYDLYKTIVTKKVNELPEENIFRKEWDSNNKYNKSYYLTPTEVFARAGEVYVAKKGFPPNSLFKDFKELETQPEYVVDNNFISVITAHFDELFKRLPDLTNN